MDEGTKLYIAFYAGVVYALLICLLLMPTPKLHVLIMPSAPSAPAAPAEKGERGRA